MKKIILLSLILLSLSLLFILGCSDSEITSDATAKVSTLTIKVISDNGAVIPEAEIFVDDNYVGSTSKYGESKGKKTIIFTGKYEKTITAKKKGYIEAKPATVFPKEGPQFLTMILTRGKTAYRVLVEEENGRKVEDAKVSLYKNNELAPLLSQYTGRNGVVIFEDLPDGIYMTKVMKTDYLPGVKDEYLNFVDTEGLLKNTIILSKKPVLIIDVQDKNKQVLSDAEVSLYTENSYNNPSSGSLEVKYTDSSGEVQFKDADVDEDYVIVVKKKGYQAQTKTKTFFADDSKLFFEMANEK